MSDSFAPHETAVLAPHRCFNSLDYLKDSLRARGVAEGSFSPATATNIECMERTGRVRCATRSSGSRVPLPASLPSRSRAKPGP